jgi:hypothetical protein
LRREEDPVLARREELLRPLLLRPRVLRPLLLRALELFLRLREDLRPLLLARLAPPRRLRALPPLFRPDDAERDRFLPPLERLDFLAAAISKLHCRRVRVPRIARFAHNTASVVAMQASQQRVHQPSARVSPCFKIHKSSTSLPAASQPRVMRAGGSSIGSSVSLKVPQWPAVTIIRMPF